MKRERSVVLADVGWNLTMISMFMLLVPFVVLAARPSQSDDVAPMAESAPAVPPVTVTAPVTAPATVTAPVSVPVPEPVPAPIPVPVQVTAPVSEPEPEIGIEDLFRKIQLEKKRAGLE